MAKLLKGDITNNVLELNLLDESVNLLSTGGTPTVVTKHSGINVNEQIVGDIPDDKYKYVLPYDERVKGLHIGTSCTSIGSYSFAGADELAGSLVIPDSVITIGDYAFIDCDNITSLTIGGNVNSIGSYAFKNCDFTGTLTIPSNIENINNNTFENATINITNLDLGDVKIIGDYAFSNLGHVGPLSISDSVTTIGEYAFNGGSSITSLTLGNNELLTRLERGVFQNCLNISSITMGDNIVSVGNYAFRSCAGLTEINWGSNITSIGSLCFNNCSSLTEITIPGSITDIGGFAFRECTEVTAVNIYCSSDVFEPFNNQFFGCNKVVSLNVRADDNSWDRFVTYPEINNIIYGYAFGLGAGDGTLELNKIL